MRQRVYDQIAVPYTRFANGQSMDELMAGSSIQINFLSAMDPGVTAISQIADVVPQTLRDAIASVTPTSRGEALQWAQQLDIQVYTDYTARAYERLGENQMESVEILALDAATQGSWVERTAVRASLDAGTSTDRASDSIFRKYHAHMLSQKVPGFIDDNGEANTFSAIMHPFPFHDIAESGNVDSIGLYQMAGIHLNFELGKIGPFRLIVSPYAKVFLGAGADNGTDVDTTLNGAVNKLATSVVSASDVSSNITAGLGWMIGTEETGSTNYPDNERIKVLSASTTTLTILGEAENGGLRYDHASGASVRNADSVYPIVLAGPESLVKVFATDVGEFGEVVGPKKQGVLDQFNTLGWKFFGGYGRFAENRLLRVEVSTSYEA